MAQVMTWASQNKFSTTPYKFRVLFQTTTIEDEVIQIQSRSMSDPPLFDIDFKNKIAWVWTTINSYASNWVKVIFLIWIKS